MIKRNIQTVLLLLTVVLMVSLVSCDPAKKYEKEESIKIQDYINININQNFVLKPSGLYYQEVTAGTGRIPVKHDTAYVKYTGKFLDGTVFDTNVGLSDSLIFPVDEGWLITGFDEGITLMRERGKAIFLLPSKLAYGPAGSYPYIPGYSPMLFEVELVKVKAGPGK
jgi:FKBP-type peptidyl-prolyl cis-trans isomerase